MKRFIGSLASRLRHACEIDWLSWICAAFAVFGFLVWLAGVLQ